ncbi:MAG: quinone-dependent dihydroorotate dehydrogenase [bacterium]
MIKTRNKILHFLYTKAAKPLFFKVDPETLHDHMVVSGVFLGRYRITRALTGLLFDYAHPMLAQDILGVHFSNPIGLSAGFDKNGELTNILPFVGFGFAELGSVTGFRCAGNPKPRLWRLPQSRGLVVYYGLKNDGAESIAKKLSNKKFKNRIGISVAMTNCKENNDIPTAVEDYKKAFGSFLEIGDYITINISCPNTMGGQPFILPENLELLLAGIDTIATQKPIFIKLSPDMNHDQIDIVLDIAKHHRVHGIICTNLTKKRDNPLLLDSDIPTVGGISGVPVAGLADDMIAYIYKKEKDRFVLIGVGGVFSAEDAYKKIRNGASLIQIITGMIFEGPQLISEINRGLVELLKKDGFANISEAVGVDVY